MNGPFEFQQDANGVAFTAPASSPPSSGPCSRSAASSSAPSSARSTWCSAAPAGAGRGQRRRPLGRERREVDRLGRDLGEGLVGVALLLGRGVEEAHGLAVAEQLGVGAHRAVARDLVVLDPLRGGDDPGVEHLGVDLLLEQLRPSSKRPSIPLHFLLLRGLLPSAWKICSSRPICVLVTSRCSRNATTSDWLVAARIIFGSAAVICFSAL